MNDKAISQTKYVKIFDEYQILSCKVGAIFESYKNVNAHTIGYGGTSAYTFHYIIKAVVYTKAIYIAIRAFYYRVIVIQLNKNIHIYTFIKPKYIN